MRKRLGYRCSDVHIAKEPEPAVKCRFIELVGAVLEEVTLSAQSHNLEIYHRVL